MNAHEGVTFDEARAMIDGRNVTADPERYALYRLCECTTCEGRGKVSVPAEEHETEDEITFGPFHPVRCPDCRGEGRTRDLIATCGTPEALGVAIVTLAREGEWEGCPIGILDTLGEPGEKWLVRPWLPSARNISDAGRTLAKARKPIRVRGISAHDPPQEEKP